MLRYHKLPFGAEPTADGVRFRLWAPSASAVSLRIEDVAARAIPMLREENGWCSLTTAAARPGTRYRYVVGEKAVPDPRRVASPPVFTVRARSLIPQSMFGATSAGAADDGKKSSYTSFMSAPFPKPATSPGLSGISITFRISALLPSS